MKPPFRAIRARGCTIRIRTSWPPTGQISPSSGSGGGDGEYTVAFIGEPTKSGRWQLQFGGHHLAVNNTYMDGQLIGATPAFRGIEPFGPFHHGGVRCDPVSPKRDALAATLTGLSDAQVAVARIADGLPDLLLGPGMDWAFPASREGIAGAELDSRQRRSLLTAIETFVADFDECSAERILDSYRIGARAHSPCLRRRASTRCSRRLRPS